MVGSMNASSQIDKHEDNVMQADKESAHIQPAKDCDVASRKRNQTKCAAKTSARSGWKKFGQAAIDELEGKQTAFQVHERDAVFIEPPGGDATQTPTSLKSNKVWEGITRRKLELKYGVSRSQGDQAFPQDGAIATSPKKKYIPPHARLAARFQHHQGSENSSIRVSNLSSSVTESDLHELFQYFGRISRVYIPKDKETMQSRGFGFVTYCSKADAESAVKGLQGHGYDYRILHLEWATPPKANTEYRSGYGGRLAQDSSKYKMSWM